MEQKKFSPRFFFISVGVLASLITVVSAFISLAFATLEKVFPDALNGVYQYGYNSYAYDAMRSPLAILIIITPIFLVLARTWVRSVRVGLSHHESVLYRWMNYVVLFLTAAVVSVDLITLVRYFVAGEITTRFILKVAVVLLVGVFAGWYFLLHLKKDRPTRFQNTISFVKVAAWTLALIIWAFTVMGGPGQQRVLRTDQRRIEDLQNIQSQVIYYWQQKSALPETLSDIATPLSGYLVPKDPESAKGFIYEYKKDKKLSFSLCATFGAPLPEGWQEYSGGGVYPMMDVKIAATSAPYGGVPESGSSWAHEAGYTCFTRTIDPALYPPFPKS